MLTRKDSLDVFFCLNKMYNTAKDPRKKSWRGKTTYKDDIFVVFTIEKLSTYYVVGRTWPLASNRPGCKTWCLHLVARWPWQVAKESRSPQEWQGAKHHPAQLWELSDLYESGEWGSCHPRHLPPDQTVILQIWDWTWAPVF